MLSRAGIPVATHDHTQLGINIGDELWEIKSPDGNPVRCVESSLRRAKKQFTDRFGSGTTIKVVLNFRYVAKISDDENRKRLVLEMQRHEVSEVILINKDGTVEFLFFAQ